MSLSNLPTIRPSLLLDFQKAEVVDSRVTFTRASTATRFNSYGVLESVANNVPRIDFNPTTLVSQGLLIEEQRTNSIRNNTMQGAVAGTPGTNPTNWTNSTGGLTKTIVGTGTANGITYTDFRFNGTTTSDFLAIAIDASNVIAASDGQTWTLSAWLSVVNGSTTNITNLFLQLGQYSSVPAFLSNRNGSNIVSSVTSALTRFSSTLTTNNASVAFIQPSVVIGFAIGVAIDITLRIGLPQLEQGAFATSVIPTTTTALTRNADVASMTGTNFSSWYNASEGTVFTQSVCARQVSAGGTGVIRIGDGTTNEEINVFYRAVGSTGFSVTVGGTTQADLAPTGVLTANTIAKIAGAYKLNDFATSGNGGAVTTDPSGTLPTVNRMEIGYRGVYLNGWIQRISYYPVRLPNAQLQALTA